MANKYEQLGIAYDSEEIKTYDLFENARGFKNSLGEVGLEKEIQRCVNFVEGKQWLVDKENDDYPYIVLNIMKQITKVRQAGIMQNDYAFLVNTLKFDDKGFLIETLEFDGGNFASLKTQDEQQLPEVIKVLEGHKRSLRLKLFYKDHLISKIYHQDKFSTSVLDETIVKVLVAVDITDDGSIIFLFEPLKAGTTKLVVKFRGEELEVNIRVDSYTLEYKEKAKVGEEVEVKTSIQDAILKVPEHDIFEVDGLKYKGLSKGKTSLKVYSAEYGTTIELEVEFTSKGCNSGTIILPLLILSLGVGFMRGNNHLREDLESEDKKKK